MTALQITMDIQLSDDPVEAEWVLNDLVVRMKQRLDYWGLTDCAHIETRQIHSFQGE